MENTSICVLTVSSHAKDHQDVSLVLDKSPTDTVITAQGLFIPSSEESMTSYIYGDVTNDCHKYPAWLTGVLAAVISAIAIITLSGNSLVIFCFATDAKLRTFGNFFILNLAIADLVIGVLICFYTPYFLSGCWRLGRAGCIAFNVIDYITPLASAWNMAVISLDRYCSVAYAIKYRLKQGPRLAAVFMAIPWLVGTAVFLPSVVFWEYFTGRQAVPDGSCFVEFYYKEPFLVFVSMVEFIIPFVVVFTINLLIYFNIKRRSRGAVSMATSSTAATGPASTANQDAARALARDKKSARSLAILVGVFLVTWAPYEICALVNPICGFCVPDAVFDVVFWLLWINSTVNPILYPFLQQRFRVAFVRVLCCGRKNKVDAATIATTAT